MTVKGWKDAVAAAPNGLASVVLIEDDGRRAICRTRDDHAAHALEMLAARRGLLSFTSTRKDGTLIVSVTGFSRYILAEKCPARTDGGACSPFQTGGTVCEYCNRYGAAR